MFQLNKQDQANQNLPYMINSNIQIVYHGTLTYEQLLNAYDLSLLRTLQSINNSMLGQVVYIFYISMFPENIGWRTWKNNNQIQRFLEMIKDDIESMPVSQEKDSIIGLRTQVTQSPMGSQNWVRSLQNLLNKIAANLYLRKAEQFLIFIEHCVSIDKWNMKIYKQMTIEKAPTMFNKFTNMFSSESSKTENQKERDFFLTITSDGILKSDNHLLESRITFMVPFTNQLTYECKTSPEKYITFIVQSCAHEQLVINFFHCYYKAINFIVGLKVALEESSYSLENRFNSYSPQRLHCDAKLYCDGEEYYADMWHCLSNARKQVCITGWMISPYFLLVRPNKIEQKKYRLDGVLQSIAERGVKVYIICFMEPKLVVNNDSEYVQTYLQALHDNIKVYRHPNGAIPLLWSHHEKLVIIDQDIGFMGGLDICYGRWDNHEHRLKDPGDLWDGADYNNYRTKDITNPRDYQNSNLNKNFQVRMPWHDIALQYRGDIVLDLLRHFVQYWYFVKSELCVDPLKTLNFLKKRYEQAFYNATNRGDKEISNYYVAQIQKRQEVLTFAQKMKYMINGREERFPELLIEEKPGKIVGNQKLQMCRSASEWSIGVRPGQHESSIHNAYIDLIKKSKRFIYIQNQFFMGLENKIVECLAQRIIRASKNNQLFKVIVVMPLLPGFQGNIGDPASTVLRIQVHYQFQAILRDGDKSLFSKLKKQNIKAEDYIHFFGLRTSQQIDTYAKTQIIYVHSKLMIVDDERCIIGSANINDRSLLGTRDSELACIIEIDMQKKMQMNENLFENNSIFDLRSKIFEEHFGLDKQTTAMFPSNQVWKQIIYNSVRATEFYAYYFKCIPDDTITVGSEIDEFEKKVPTINLAEYRQNKKQLRGHAVEFPLNFMKDEDLRLRRVQKQYYAPEISFT